MKRLLALLLGLCLIAQAQAITCTTASKAQTSTSVQLAITAALHDTIIIIAGQTASAAPTSVTATSGTPVVGQAWGGSSLGNGRYTGMWYIADAAAGSNTISVNNTASTLVGLMLLSCPGLDTTAPFDKSATLNDNGSTQGTAVSTNSATPAASGEYSIAWWNAESATGRTSTTWTSGFTQEVNINSGGAVAMAAADITLGAPAPTNTTTTLSANAYWVAGLAFFKAASAGSTCTHAGWNVDTRSFSVPTAGVGNFWLQSDAKGPVDCSTTQYWQSGSVFGAN